MARQYVTEDLIEEYLSGRDRVGLPLAIGQAEEQAGGRTRFPNTSTCVLRIFGSAEEHRLSRWELARALFGSEYPPYIAPQNTRNPDPHDGGFWLSAALPGGKTTYDMLYITIESAKRLLLACCSLDTLALSVSIEGASDIDTSPSTTMYVHGLPLYNMRLWDDGFKSLQEYTSLTPEEKMGYQRCMEEVGGGSDCADAVTAFYKWRNSIRKQRMKDGCVAGRSQTSETDFAHGVREELPAAPGRSQTSETDFAHGVREELQTSAAGSAHNVCEAAPGLSAVDAEKIRYWTLELDRWKHIGGREDRVKMAERELVTLSCRVAATREGCNSKRGRDHDKYKYEHADAQAATTLHRSNEVDADEDYIYIDD